VVAATTGGAAMLGGGKWSANLRGWAGRQAGAVNGLANTFTFQYLYLAPAAGQKKKK
jgi:hypothetical protein